MKKNEDYSLFFDIYEYNAYQIYEIILNQNIGAVDNNFFRKINSYSFNDLSFSYEPSSSTQANLVSGEKILSHQIRYVTTSASYFSYEKEVVVVSIISLFVDMIEPCGKGAICENNTLVPDVYGYIDDAVHRFYQKQGTYTYSDMFIPSSISGVVSLGDVYNTMYYPELKINLSGYISNQTHTVITIGTYYSSIYCDGSLHHGLYSVSGVLSNKSEIKILVFDTILYPCNSEFWFKVTTSFKESSFLNMYSGEAVFSINRGFLDLEGFFDRTESIWMKMFFPTTIGQNELSATVMSMNVSDFYSSKEFNIPFYYVDDFIETTITRGKAGEGSLAEKKVKDSDGDGIFAGKIIKPIDEICGSSRKTTYLEYQGFDHILNYENSDRIWGNLPMAFKETINSPYLKIVENDIILPGVMLSNADALSKAITQSRLAHIDNLSAVYDWKVEDFKIEAEDFTSLMLDAASMDRIDESFRRSFKFVMSTLGEEVPKVEKKLTTEEHINIFPYFPGRPIDDNYLEITKIRQFFVIQKREDV